MRVSTKQYQDAKQLLEHTKEVSRDIADRVGLNLPLLKAIAEGWPLAYVNDPYERARAKLQHRKGLRTLPGIST